MCWRTRLPTRDTRESSKNASSKWHMCKPSYVHTKKFWKRTSIQGTSSTRQWIVLERCILQKLPPAAHGCHKSRQAPQCVSPGIVNTGVNRLTVELPRNSHVSSDQKKREVCWVTRFPKDSPFCSTLEPVVSSHWKHVETTTNICWFGEPKYILVQISRVVLQSDLRIKLKETSQCSTRFHRQIQMLQQVVAHLLKKLSIFLHRVQCSFSAACIRIEFSIGWHKATTLTSGSSCSM